MLASRDLAAAAESVPLEGLPILEPVTLEEIREILRSGNLDAPTGLRLALTCLAALMGMGRRLDVDLEGAAENVLRFKTMEELRGVAEGARA